MIETESWIPNPEKEGFLKYQGQKLVSDVFNESPIQVISATVKVTGDKG